MDKHVANSPRLDSLKQLGMASTRGTLLQAGQNIYVYILSVKKNSTY